MSQKDYAELEALRRLVEKQELLIKSQEATIKKQENKIDNLISSLKIIY